MNETSNKNCGRDRPNLKCRETYQTFERNKKDSGWDAAPPVGISRLQCHIWAIRKIGDKWSWNCH